MHHDKERPVTLGPDYRLAERLTGGSGAGLSERAAAVRRLLALPSDHQDQGRRGCTVKFAEVDWKKLRKFLARKPRTPIAWVTI